MLVAFTGKMLFLNWPRPVQYRNETSHGSSQTFFYMENFIGQHLLLARWPFFISVMYRGGHLKKNTLYDLLNVLRNAIHWLFPLILVGECFWLIGNGWYGAIKNRWRH